MGRWIGLAAFTAFLWASTPFTLPLGNALLATALGRWLLGPGLVVAAVVGTGGLVVALRRDEAPTWAVALVTITLPAFVALVFFAVERPLERVHLPLYGIVALLAWHALRGHTDSDAVAYAGAVLLAGLIGWGEELVQHLVPERYFDWRDVRANAAAGGLAIVVLAALRSRRGQGNAA